MEPGLASLLNSGWSVGLLTPPQPPSSHSPWLCDLPVVGDSSQEPWCLAQPSQGELAVLLTR